MNKIKNKKKEFSLRYELDVVVDWREPTAFDVAAARARNEAGAGAGAVRNRGQNVWVSGRQGARGGNVGRVRDGGNTRENQPR